MFGGWLTTGRRRHSDNQMQTVRYPLRNNSMRTTSVTFLFAMAIICTNDLFGNVLDSAYKISAVTALTSAQRRAIVLSRIKRGMLLSQEAKHNITAAEEACVVWENILAEPSTSPSPSSVLTRDVRSLSKTLYASCLVRVGRDEEAINVYDSCLKDSDSIENRETIRWRSAKARCLQRLLKYSEAEEEYSRIVAESKIIDNDDDDYAASVKGAITCILRSSENVTRARHILAEVSLARKVAGSFIPSETQAELLLLSSYLEYLEVGNTNEILDRFNQLFLKIDASRSNSNDTITDKDSNSDISTSFLLYRWILAASRQNHRKEKNSNKEDHLYAPFGRILSPSEVNAIDTKDIFMQLIKINASPLDDPGLLQLDDKIQLHKLLTTVKKRFKTSEEILSPSYWPDGYVLPAQLLELKEKGVEDSDLWISKSRAGYGSHGNRIMSVAEARERINTNTNISTKSGAEAQSYLFQRMIDPLMLLQGYKFSLRLYVVYFSSDEAYISSEGLVKLASTPLAVDTGGGDNKRERSRDPSIHMTNSGRETVMQQHDLGYLWNEFDSDGDKDEFWKEICNITADILLHRYPQYISTKESIEVDHTFREQKRRWHDRRENLGIPKILGLDFVVQQTADHRKKPWLVEVNRFPGLEPRDEDDRKIKYRIVRDAWKKASERMGIPGSIFESLSYGERDDERSSLEPLQLKQKFDKSLGH